MNIPFRRHAPPSIDPSSRPRRRGLAFAIVARRWPGLALGLAVLAPFAARAEARPTPASLGDMSLASLLERAERANPGLDALRARRRAARARIPQETAWPEPKLSVTRFVESVQTRTGPQDHVVSLSQRLPWPGRIAGREAAASAEARAVKHAYRKKRLELAREVARAYFEYAYTGRALRLTRENLGLLRDLVPIAESRVGAGGALNELLRLKVEIGQLEDEASSLKQKRVSQSTRLRAMLALDGDAPLPWPTLRQPGFASLDAGALRAAAKANHPGLRMRRARIESAEAERALARLESFPDVTLGLTYIDVGSPVAGNPDDGGQDPWGVSVSVNLPIWGNANRAARDEARSRRKALERAYAQRWNEIRAELTDRVAQWRDARRRVRLYDNELLGLARQSVDNSRASYENGRTGILEVIDSERTLLDLQRKSWRAVADAWQARASLRTLSGRSLLRPAADEQTAQEPEKAGDANRDTPFPLKP